MKNYKKNLTQIFYWFVLIPMSVSCRKNEDYIVVQKTPLTTGILLKINSDQFVQEAFGAQCSIDNDEIINVSNTPVFLSENVDPSTLQSGDFVLSKQTSSGTTSYLIYFVYAFTNNGITDYLLLVDNVTEVDQFERGDNYAQGSHHGTFESVDQTIQLDYELSFITRLEYDPTLCP